ncbi:MAG: hypothetical protein KJN63_03735 [Acidimicrobiia bacterium]|nr:hypothetical protein [Acidimicrobiia bacterium]
MTIAVTPQRDDGGDGSEPELTEDSVVTAAIWNADDSHSSLSDISIVHQGVRICDLPALAGTAGTDLRCALGLDWPPRWRRRALSVLRSVEGVSDVIGVDQPVAAFANGWHQDPTSDPDRPLQIVAVAHQHPRTMVVGHTGQHSLVSVGPFEGPDEIRAITENGARSSQQHLSIEVPLRWASTLGTVGRVITYGLDLTSRNEFDDLFGPLVVHHDTDGVLDGLTRMNSLRMWSACWPTNQIRLGSGWTRQPGPLRSRLEEHMVRLRPGAEIQFSDTEGRLVPVRAGSVSAHGCVIPDHLGTQPRLQLLDDGRIFLFGPDDTDPLAMKIVWPIPASGRNCIEVRAAGRAGVELVDPVVEGLVGADVGP